MLKNLFTISFFAFLLSQTSSAAAQALPTATGHGALQVGAGWTFVNPDYGHKNIQGFTGFVDFDLFSHLGVEGTVHAVNLITPEDLAEDTYLIGPRYVIHKGRFAPYAKALAGVGDLVIQESQDNPGRFSGTYFAFAIGAGLDIDVRRHIVIRAIDVEYQRWPGLGNGLSPFAYTVGAAYRFR
jgi:hypothetical protein